MWDILLIKSEIQICVGSRNRQFEISQPKFYVAVLTAFMFTIWKFYKILIVHAKSTRTSACQNSGFNASDAA
jgi:hypothetical protein